KVMGEQTTSCVQFFCGGYCYFWKEYTCNTFRRLSLARCWLIFRFLLCSRADPRQTSELCNSDVCGHDNFADVYVGIQRTTCIYATYRGATRSFPPSREA